MSALYANGFLVRNSANSKPGVSIDPNAVRTAGDYRLFNRFKARIASSEGQVEVFISNGAAAAVVGSTPNPCGSIFPSSSGETHTLNGATGLTSNRLRVYQLNEGRIGDTGQSVDRTLNYYGQAVGSGTPWIWSAIKFNVDGTLAPLDHQIFPTYSVYRNGLLVQTLPQSQPGTFIALTSTSQRSTGEIN